MQALKAFHLSVGKAEWRLGLQGASKALHDTAFPQFGRIPPPEYIGNLH